MYNLNIIKDIEDTILEELKILLKPVNSKLLFGKTGTIAQFGGKNTASAVKPSVNVMCAAGEIIRTTMSRYEISLDIYINIITTNIKDEAAKRHDLYPILTAILFCLSGKRFDNFTLEPKQNFEQRDCTELFLEYDCLFTAKFLIPKPNEEHLPDLLGIIANYYADPENMPYAPADARDIIKNVGADIIRPLGKE